MELDEAIKWAKEKADSWRDALKAEDVYTADERKVFNDCIDALDALRAAAEAGRWRPIETAPKDGTQILACLLDRHLSGGAAYYLVEWETFDIGGISSAGVWRDQDDGQVIGVTHWRPLPPAPEA